MDFSYIGNQLIELFRLELLDFSELVVDICKRLRFLFSIEAKSVLEFFESPFCVLVVHVEDLDVLSVCFDVGENWL